MGDAYLVDGDSGTREYQFHKSFVCSNCRHLLVGTLWSDPNSNEAAGSYDSFWDTDNKSIKWVPATVSGKEFPDVPPHIASAADEAFKCRSISALRACIMLARGVVEATAKEQGVRKGLLFQKIDSLHDQGIIRTYTQEAAHELRFLGNDMAHGDFVEAVDIEDADAILDVMAEILNEVYQGPARVERMRGKRAGKRAESVD